MNEILLIPKKLYERCSHFVETAILFDRSAQILASAGDGKVNVLTAQYAIATIQSSCEAGLDNSQIWQKNGERISVIFPFFGAYLLLDALVNYQMRLEDLVNFLESIEKPPKLAITSSDKAFLTQCQNILQKYIGPIAPRLASADLYLDCEKNIVLFLEEVTLDIPDPIIVNKFLEEMQLLQKKGTLNREHLTLNT